MSDERTLMGVISDYWEFIISAIAFIAGYVNLKAQSFNNKESISEMKSRIGRLEDRLDTKLDSVQESLKEILILIGGKK